MKIRKRYLLLILIGLLPLYKFIHPNDYCFGEDDIVIVGTYAVLFFIVFLAILFNNFYMITLKKELVNYRPVLIAVVYSIGFTFLVQNHTSSYFKEKAELFLLQDQELDPTRVQLFQDNTFEYQKTTNRVVSNNLITTICYSKGEYEIKDDAIYFRFNDQQLNDNYLDKVYRFNQSKDSLIPDQEKFLPFLLERIKNKNF